MRTLTTGIPSGIRGTSRTIREMHALVRLATQDPQVAHAASRIISDVPRRDYRGEAAAILAWTQQQCRYTRDPWTADGLERVSHPVVTLARGAEDCDGLAVLLASLAASVGFPYAFRTVGTDRARPNDFQHVYVMLYISGRGWVAADPSFEQELGWEPARNGTLMLPDGTTIAAAEVVRDWTA